jgi:hypothetical protein
MMRERYTEVKHTTKEREQLQRIAKSYFKDGQMLHDKFSNEIFKFELNRDYHMVATTPERFSVYKSNKLKVRF